MLSSEETSKVSDPPHPPEPGAILQTPVLSTSAHVVNEVFNEVAGLNITSQEVNVVIGAGAVGSVGPSEIVHEVTETAAHAAVPKGSQTFAVRAEIEALKSTTSNLKKGTNDILPLLITFKADEAMIAIHSIKMPAPSTATNEPHATFKELRELSHTALKVSIFVGASDLALRGIWKDVELWGFEVTSVRYRNSLSTFEAVLQLLNANVPEPNHPSKFQVFRQTIQKSITKEYRRQVSREGVEEQLWLCFGVAFKAYLMPDSTDEKNAIYRKIFFRFRAKQTSILSATAFFKQSMTQLAALDAPKMNFEDYMLFRFLQLGPSELSGLGRSLYGCFSTANMQEIGQESIPSSASELAADRANRREDDCARADEN